MYSTDDSRVRRAGVLWGVDGRLSLMVLDAEILVCREAVGSVHHDATP